MKRVYGDTDDLIATVRSWGIRKVEFLRTRNSVFVPLALKLPFMLGAMSIITGEK
jgi:acid phosphatase class B